MISAVTARVEALAKAERLLLERKLSDAIACFDEAEWHGADMDRCSSGRWLASMLSGDFESAWKESDEINRRGQLDPQRFWRGVDLAGKRVILRCLHGFGDAVQFLRYVPALQRLVRSLVVEVPPALLGLARFFNGIDQVITWGSLAPATAPAWDEQIEINELPYIFRTQASELPLTTRYIHLPDKFLNDCKVEPQSPSSLRVGVVWACGEWNPGRNLPFELLAETVRLSGCEFWNLQGGKRRTDWRTLPQQSTLHDAEICKDSILHLAGTIAQLDLVLTPDTLAAHLAGALNVPAWVILEFAADWRWQHGRSDSPWYPSLQLFRQPTPGDWHSVIAELNAKLIQQTALTKMRGRVA